MKIRIKILFFLILTLVATGTSLAQRIKATASLDSTKILLGDQVKLFLEIDHPKNIKVDFPAVPDTILKRIEVLNRSGIDTFASENESFQKEIQSYLITCFDSGSYRIPPYWFKINMNGRMDSIPSNGVTLNVFSMAIDTTKGPADIKMPYDAPLTLKEVTPYILGVILIGAIIFLILYSINRKKKNKPLFSRPPKPKEPAHIIALRELDRIKDEKLWQAGKTKLFYSEVTDALRKYIEDRFEIKAMEQTTEETLSSFKYRNDLVNEKSFNNFRKILTLADLVKFAKYSPLPDDNNLTLVNAYFFVNETKKEVIKKPEEMTDEENDGKEVAIK
ncbi:MAG: hypothetical protein J7L95_06340 [Prolixibacteraceae bacterium]|nr:hypothetical protein [Prolixibacteraceae bacterium]